MASSKGSSVRVGPAIEAEEVASGEAEADGVSAPQPASRPRASPRAKIQSDNGFRISYSLPTRACRRQATRRAKPGSFVAVPVHVCQNLLPIFFLSILQGVCIWTFFKGIFRNARLPVFGSLDFLSLLVDFQGFEQT